MMVPSAGYLTLKDSGIWPVLTADAVNRDTLYWRPLASGDIAVRSAASGAIEMRQSGPLALTLNSGHAANILRDVFSFDPGDGSTTLVLGAAWSSSTPGNAIRGTGADLARDAASGLLVNAAAMSGMGAGAGVWLGTINPYANGKLRCDVSAIQSPRWDVWNAFNQRPLELRCTYPAHDWIIASLTWVPPNASQTATNPPGLGFSNANWVPPAAEDWSTGATLCTGMPMLVCGRYDQVLFESVEGMPPQNCNVDLGIRVNAEVYVSGNPAARGFASVGGVNNTDTITAGVSIADAFGPIKLTPVATIESGISGAKAQFWGVEESCLLVARAMG